MRRKGRLMIPVVSLLMLLGGGVGILGQDKPAPPSRHDGFSMGGVGVKNKDRGTRPFPPDPTFNFVGSEMRFGGPTVKGAPYSATVITEAVQTLANGTRISQKTTASVYRDGEGRTRREQTFGAIGSFRAAGDAPQMTFIEDPVAGA